MQNFFVWHGSLMINGDTLMQIMQYVEHTIGPDPLIDSDRESNKSDDSESMKTHHMYVWNPKYEVCCIKINICIYIVRIFEAFICNVMFINKQCNIYTILAHYFCK